MQTPFDETSSNEWAARSETPRRSVFGNYHPGEADAPPFGVPPSGGSPANGVTRTERSCAIPPEGGTPNGLQAAIDAAVARAFLYQFLARAFEDPAQESWAWLTNASTHLALQSVARVLAKDSTALKNSAVALVDQLQPDRFESFQIAYVTAFGHAARGDCPLNEIEYGDLKADPLFQPHRLADLAAFYRAFGLEVAEGAAERPDHLGMELEFMSVLAAREAYAHEHQLDNEQRELCRDAQKKFLREHLGRWSPAFARRLVRAATDDTLAALAGFTRDFIAVECARLGLAAGSEDLLLRPVDEAAERLCDSCALAGLPPGALTTKET
jgi:DMSO reductase family type II enzyme chaperone